MRRRPLRIALVAATLLLGGAALPAPRTALAQAPATPAASAPAPSPAPSGTVLLREQEVWSYAESLFRQGEYYRAVSEYKRLLYYFPATTLAPSARIRIGEALLLGEARLAIAHFTALLAQPLPPRMDDTVLYLRGMSYLDLEPDLPYSLRIDHIRAGLADLRLTDPDLPYKEQVNGLLRDLDNPRDLPEKSPWLAGGLSAAVPGLGSLYVGNYSEAALALFSNTLLIYATVTAFQEEQAALAAFFGTFSLAFYGGNIYAAANGALKYNDRAQSAYLAERRVAWGIVPRKQGLSANLLLSF